MDQQSSFRPYVIHTQSEGEEFDFYVGNELAKEWYDTGCPDSRSEMGFIRDHLIQKGSLVVECGCNHGFTTLLLSKWVGDQGKVIAFDANSENVAIARKNMELNEIKNVEIHVDAVGNQIGTLSVTAGTNAEVASPFVQGEVEVTAIRLDDYLASQIPDLIKIDIEGYELECLKGLGSTLAKKNSNLSIEVHAEALRSYSASVADLFEFIGLEDYVCWLGVGGQANEGIQRFMAGESQIPALSRFYLFAIPRNKVVSTAHNG
jgi:FkbM family methyltransferase